MSQLFSPVQLGELTLDNRIVIAPMCQYAAQQGCASHWHGVHLSHLALSGAGLLMIEATAVEEKGRISPHDLGLWDDKTALALAEVIRLIREISPIRLGIQLAHAGRKASVGKLWQGSRVLTAGQGGWQTVAPSPLSFQPDMPLPEELQPAEIEELIVKFVDSARRAAALGLDSIEIHAAHGHLLHQFLSPLSNQRIDEYGGSLVNRMRFPLAVFRAVRAAVPTKMAVGVRISATDWVAGGWDLEQSVTFCRELEALNCDYIDVSSGGLSPLQKISVAPGYQVPFAREIRRHVSVPVMAVGLITDAQQAENILQQGSADLIALGRGILYDPRWPWHAAAVLGGQVNVPEQYLSAEPRQISGTFKTVQPH